MRRLCLPLIVLVVLGIFASAGSAATPRPVGAPGSWSMQWRDDFSAPPVDLAKWSPNWSAWGSPNTAVTWPASSWEQSCYDPAQSSVSRGRLSITAVQRDCPTAQGTTSVYASDLLSTWNTKAFTFGFFEARVWLQASNQEYTADWPQFWLDGFAAWPTNGEIDIMEGSPYGLHASYHWGTQADPQFVTFWPTLASQAGWHTFGVDWRSGSITWWYDGVQVAQTTQNVSESAMFLNVGLGVQRADWPVIVPTTMRVDYVRVWRAS